MKDLEKLEYLETINSDKQKVIHFLKAFDLEIVDKKVKMVFSDSLESKTFKELWHLKSEPHVVKVQFIIENPKLIQKEKLEEILQILIDKIANRDFPEQLNHSIQLLEPIPNNCQHFRSIKFSIKPNGVKVTLIGGICYCN